MHMCIFPTISISSRTLHYLPCEVHCINQLQEMRPSESKLKKEQSLVILPTMVGDRSSGTHVEGQVVLFAKMNDKIVTLLRNK